ncbi:hypothetical protein [Myceligenerans pegani]|uniref:Uncharacterized protein n=1 Tax=Myceligenerans pegani TaxID=2776917 RepID=A0ABR9MXD2_9MICO|nr:hypothetical protein [Myceligenerans sp. TRM 65318]MBE1876033.1 hypothetical protein [Myceligenerans sp. TRM 65318]MBE3018304.1 hypothetical protein [Myceligenerans sp. TRM 65318]
MIAVACVGVVALISPTAASASVEPGPSETVQPLAAADEARVQRNLEELGIDDTTGSRLLSMLQRGELPGSATGEDEIDSWTEKRDGGIATVLEYADGSRRIVGVRPVDPGVEALVTHNCEEPQGAGYWVWGPCEIYSQDMISYAGFTASWVYTADHERFPAEIRDPVGETCYGVFITVTECELDIERLVADPPLPARVTLDYTWEALDGIAGGSGSFWLNVEPGYWYIDESQG